MKERRYWDSDCFLAWLRNEPERADKCGKVFALAERGKVEIVTSALTIAEVLHLRPADAIPEERRASVEEIFDRPYIRTMTLTRRLAEQARELVWKHRIRPKDAVHVASALAAKATILNTFDRQLIGKSERVGDPPLVIEPPEVDEPELDLDRQGSEAAAPARGRRS